MTNIYDENYQKEAVIFVDGIEYVVKRIDIHHFSMDYRKIPGNPAIWHIGQLHYNCPYKQEITEWLRNDSVDISLREYHWENKEKIMKNREEIMGKINELNALYRDMKVILAGLRGKYQLSDNVFWELIELIEEPICQKLYLGDYEYNHGGLYVAWGKDETNVPQFLVFEDNVHFPVNNLHVSPDIYGIGEASMDAIIEYKMSYLEEKFNFYKEY